MAINTSLIDRYGADTKGPYYTSYPTLGEWSENFSDQDFKNSLDKFISQKDNSFSLYIHYPYCVKLCHFCICNAYATGKKENQQKALDYLIREMGSLNNFFQQHDSIPNIKEIHFGGGSPSFLDIEDFEKLVDKIELTVKLGDIDEVALEIDPRTATLEKMHYYANRGIDRISFGIQDFDPVVQNAINRVQPFDYVEKFLSEDIRKKYKSLNFDLLYGLPFQTRESFRKTMDLTCKISPERVTLLRYAHVPDIKKNMRLIDDAKIVDNTEKTIMFIESTEKLLAEGYEYIGIDNFAKPTDALAIAFKNKTVGRNFIGFTPGRVNNMIGIGPSATSVFGEAYAQNVYNLIDYYKTDVDKHFPIERGHKMSRDDFIRRDAIFRILCDLSINWDEFDNHHGINSREYFNEEIKELNSFIYSGILESENGSINITKDGRYFLRHVAGVFDSYVKNKPEYIIHGT